METETLALAQEIDFSMWGLFARATITVQLVMLVLVLASVWSWAIILVKHRDYKKARANAAAFDEAFWSGEPLEGLYEQVGSQPGGRVERIFAAGMSEWQRSYKEDGGKLAGAQVRIDRSMDVAIQKEAEDLQSNLPILATVGSTAPFVGLFGTVWGRACGPPGPARSEWCSQGRCMACVNVCPMGIDIRVGEPQGDPVLHGCSSGLL